MNKHSFTITGSAGIFRIIILCLVLYLCLAFNALGQMNHMNQINQMSKTGLPHGIMDRILALAYIHKLDEQAVQDLLLPLKRAMDQDFPVHTLLLKIQEGLSKKITTERIVATLNIMITRFESLDIILKRLPPHTQRHRKKTLNIMNGLVAMGIAIEEIEARLTESEGFPPRQVFKAMEIKVALSNAGLSAEDVDSIVEQGLQSGFFQRPGCWTLAHVIYAAGKMGTEPKFIYQISMQVIKGEKTLGEAAGELGIDHKQPGFCRGMRNGPGWHHKR